VITYSATLDVPRALAQHVARLLLVERVHRGTRRGRRALGVFSHAVLVLRWFREAATVQILVRDHGIGISTCYRYLHEAITVLAPAASELPEVLHERLAAGDTHVILDGTLIRSDRGVVTTQNEKGKTINLWYSGKHKAFGGNVQFGVDRRRISVVVLRGVPRQPPRPGRSARTRCDRGVVRRQPRKDYRAWRTRATTSRASASTPRSKTRPATRSAMSTTAASTVCSPGFAAWVNEPQRYCSPGGRRYGGSRYASLCAADQAGVGAFRIPARRYRN
jgi:hypothetical protein